MINWWTQPTRNAAGRMALARIVYAVFFLFFLSYMDISEVAGAPYGSLVTIWHALPGIDTIAPLIEPVMVFLLILLVFGLHTRLTTGLLLLVGIYWMGLHRAFTGLDQTVVLLVVLVPLLGLFSQWGDVYSVDAHRAKSHPDPAATDWYYYWAGRMTLVILAFLYFTAGWNKIFSTRPFRLDPQGWLLEPNVLGALLQFKAGQSAVASGAPIFAPAVEISQIPLLTVPMQYAVLLFEVTFPLVLVSAVIYGVYFRLLPFFHFGNVLFLGIPFLPVVGVYILLIDWQWLSDDLGLKLPQQFKVPVWAVLLGAATTALLWNLTPIPRTIFGVGGLFAGNRAFWLAIMPLVLFVYWRQWKAATSSKSPA